MCAIISKWAYRIASNETENREMLLLNIQNVAYHAIAELHRIAADGNQQAALALLDLLAGKVAEFDALCRANPSWFESKAHEMTCWPGIISRFSDQEKRNKELIDRLNLSADVPLNLSGKQASSATQEAQIALFLWRIIDLYRRDYLPENIKRLQDARRDINQRLGRPANYVVPPPKIKVLPNVQAEFKLIAESRQMAKDLPPFSRSNCVAWFKASWPLFLSRWKLDFENRKCFGKYWANKAYQNGFGKPIRSRIRDAIKKNIKQAFRSIAPKSS